MLYASVDESGDPGTGGKGTPWFSWVAFVARHDHLAGFRAVRGWLASCMPGQSGEAEHWCAEKRRADDLVASLRVLARLPGWDWLAVVSKTTLSTPETARYIHDPTEHRYWTLLWLLERLSWLGESRSDEVCVFVERPNDSAFTEKNLRERYSTGLPRGRGANYEFLKPTCIRLATPAHWPFLNFADTLAHAVHKAVNPHPRWGQTFPEYLQLVWRNVWVGPVWGGRSLQGYGFVLLPFSISTALAWELPFLDDWRAVLDLSV